VKAQFRAVVVVALAVISLAYTAPDLILPWHPWGNFGMTEAVTGRTEATIASVDPGGPAARAGIRVGDKIDLAAMPLDDRRSVYTSYNTERPAKRATFQFVRGIGLQAVTLVSVPHLRTLADNVTDVIQLLTLISFPILAGALLLLRPAALTWAFFIYALDVSNGSTLSQSYAPTWLQVLEYAWSSAFGVAGLAAFIIFALRFPSNVVTGWKRTVERAVLFAAPLLLLSNLYWGLGQVFLLPHALAVSSVANAFVLLGYCVGAGAFIATLMQATPQERPRIVWVIFGFLVGYGAFASFNAFFGYAGTSPIWLTNTLQIFDVLIPITVTYAILKHRVIDIAFFLNRALVYGILTTLGIGLLVLLDWAVARRLESFGLVIEVAGALALGIAIQHLHGFVDTLVDRYVFRSVHEAEKHLERVGEAMMYAESLEALDTFLVQESARALRLASVAVFRRVDAGQFVRASALGWNGVACDTIGADDPLVLDLQAQKRGVAGGPFLSDRSDVPQGASAPIFAVPIRIRERTIGFVLFGAHLNASDIDPNEQGILESFVARATIAYDHVWNLERSAENSRMRVELDFLRGLVQPLQPSANVPE
jgi:hypothetical protein